MESIEKQSIDDYDTSYLSYPRKSSPSQLDPDLTYVPAFPATYRESNKTSTKQGEKDNANSPDYKDAREETDTSTT